ncbi:MAG: serine protein kinase RIO [Candidatus Thermoplasmatota archaeon]|nr:serine protein kinase RIO [Candidatus Thermoplasmatota archaeon]
MPKKDEELDQLERALWKIHADGRGGGIREERKTESEVWDRQTLDAVYKFMKKGIIDTVEHPISTGKEANVFLALSPEGEPLVIKIYRTSTADFRGIERYIMGDPRFPGRRSNRRQVIFAWARKEYLNLRRAHDAGVPVPEPYDFRKNVLAMDYVGEEDRAAPEVRNVRLEDPEAFYDLVMEAAATLFREAKLVHGDLSEYNILVVDGAPVLIDLGQAMLVKHPRAVELMDRDCANMARFWSKRGVDTSVEEVWRRITGKDRSESLVGDKEDEDDADERGEKP